MEVVKDVSQVVKLPAKYFSYSSSAWTDLVQIRPKKFESTTASLDPEERNG